jgi:uncharacterized protein YxjI
MLLNRSTYFVKERVGMLKLTDTYDLLDPNTQENIGIAKEDPSGFIKFLRFLVNKSLLPTHVSIYERESEPPVLTIQRGFTLLRSKVLVNRGDGQAIGYFKSKLFSLGGGFFVFDTADQQVAEVKGDWKGWNFKLLAKNGMEIGTVTKKWAGLGKELFTSADNYMISLNDVAAGNADIAGLMLAAGLAIDIVFKESK